MIERLRQEDVREVLPRLGITRVADLTGLDTLGVPVWSAIRPLARGLCVSAGKGLTHADAWMSAVMESAEQAMAERTAGLISAIDCLEGLALKGQMVVPLERQSRACTQLIDPRKEFAWCQGINLLTGEAVLAPYELVGLDFTAQAPWDREAFHMCSTGLGAGISWDMAVLHGLLELLEEDAAFAAVTGTIATAGAQCDVEVLAAPHSPLLALVAMCEERGLDMRVRKLSSLPGLSVIMVALFPEQGSDLQLRFDGIACRASEEEAAIAAILEAAQCRLTYVAGARDDLLPGEYERMPKRNGQYGALQLKIQDNRWFEAPQVGHILQTLREDAVDGVYAFDLTEPDMPFKVVRVLADSLLSLEMPRGALAGVRAARNLFRQWAAP